MRNVTETSAPPHHHTRSPTRETLNIHDQWSQPYQRRFCCVTPSQPFRVCGTESSWTNFIMIIMILVIGEWAIQPKFVSYSQRIPVQILLHARPGRCDYPLLNLQYCVNQLLTLTTYNWCPRANLRGVHPLEHGRYGS